MHHSRRLDICSKLRLTTSLALAAISLSIVAGCVESSDDSQTNSTEQGLGPNCVIQRPYAWDNGIFVCSEGPIVPSGSTITLGPGGTFQFHTVIQVVGLGRGAVTVRCRTDGSGLWDEENLSCFKRIGSEP